MNILFVSAEVAPFAKRGGLGDVAGSLPKVLQEMGHDVRVVLPAYKFVLDDLAAGVYEAKTLNPFSVQLGPNQIDAGAYESRLPGSDVPVYLIAHDELLGRDAVYGYPDDAWRFGFFSLAALELLVKELKWKPDVVHAHDWHTAPAVVWLATIGQSQPAFQGIGTLFTIHNLAHQGDTPWDIFDYLGIATHSLVEENYGQVNFMARGIYHASKVNTVSPTYAQEITTQQGGGGLDGLLRHRKEDLHGILNGLDYETWDPASDPHIKQNYDLAHMERRAANKQGLQAELGLPQRRDIPVLGMVSRLYYQKGLDLMGEVVHRLMTGEVGDVQVVILGSGEAHYEEMFAQFASAYPHKLSATFAYRADLAPKIYAGSDMFLMPSLFEPCGLGQMISMRYGCVPIVRATGGLADTVYEPITGFVFDAYTSASFWHSVQRATYVYNLNPTHWREIQRTGMLSDLSWKRSALDYDNLYQKIIDELN